MVGEHVPPPLGVRNSHCDADDLLLQMNFILNTMHGEEMKGVLVSAAVSIAALSGCASIVGSSSQPVSVQAMKGGSPVSGATCELTNDKGSWYVTTPGSVTVHKAFGDMSIKCQKESIDPALTTAKSSANGLVFGNILFGGIIGLAVDMGTGSGFDYPSMVTVLLDSMPKPASPDAKATQGVSAVANVVSAQPAPQSTETK